jgi:hypothetical protein
MLLHDGSIRLLPHTEHIRMFYHLLETLIEVFLRHINSYGHRRIPASLDSIISTVSEQNGNISNSQHPPHPSICSSK